MPVAYLLVGLSLSLHVLHRSWYPPSTLSDMTLLSHVMLAQLLLVSGEMHVPSVGSP